MGALGLTTYNQFALASTTYTDLVSILWLPGEPISVLHLVPSSTTHPQKFMGRGPATLEGVLQTTTANERGFIAAVVGTQTVRHAIWVDGDGTEVYCHVYGGAITGREFMNPWGAAANTKLVRLSFKFVCGDQRLYKGSDDSVLVGA
jgi:hypothetical protein